MKLVRRLVLSINLPSGAKQQLGVLFSANKVIDQKAWWKLEFRDALRRAKEMPKGVCAVTVGGLRKWLLAETGTAGTEGHRHHQTVRPGEGKQHRKVRRKRLFFHFSQELMLAEWLYFCPILAVTGCLGDLLFGGWFLVAPTPGAEGCEV